MYRFFYFFSLISGICLGQYPIKNCENFIRNEIIEKIQNIPPDELLPYTKNGIEWGIFDQKSQKILTPTFFKNIPIFQPDLKIDFPNCKGEISRNFDFKIIENSQENSPLTEKNSKKISVTSEAGFSVDKKGKIIAYAQAYKKFKNDNENISEPVFYKGQYFSVIKSQSPNILIDKNGKPVENFQYPKIIPMPYLKNNTPIFYIENFDKQKGLLNIKEEKILMGKILNIPKNQNFGYSIQKDDFKKDNFSGILDLTNYQWLIPPKNNLRITHIIYSSKEKINPLLEKNRKKAKIYFVAEKNENYILLDEKENIFSPKF